MATQSADTLEAVDRIGEVLEEAVKGVMGRKAFATLFLALQVVRPSLSPDGRRK